MKRFVKFLVLAPVAVVIVLLAVANRAPVELSFDPFSRTEPAVSASRAWRIASKSSRALSWARAACTSGAAPNCLVWCATNFWFCGAAASGTQAVTRVIPSRVVSELSRSAWLPSGPR